MIKDLNEIYDGGDQVDQQVPLPDPPTKKKAAPAWTPPVRTRDGFAGVSPTNVKEYIDYSPSGVSDQRGAREGGLDIMRGYNQSFGEKLGRRAANIIPNVAAGVIDMVGNIGSLVTEWGDQRDYHNALNDLADSIKNPFGETYKRSNDTWALNDPTWWIDNIASVGEMAGAFALGGMGVGKVLGGAAKVIGEGLNLGKNASLLLKGAAQLGTSGFVSYAESAQAGTQVYKDTYDAQFTKLLAKGLSTEEANRQATHIAAQSAATTAQVGTLLTMGLNVGAYAPWFRKMDDVGMDVIGKRLAGMEANATRQEVAGAIRGLKIEDYADKFFHHSSWQGRVREMGGEGAEEFLQQYAQDQGTADGKSGTERGFFQQFGQLETILDKTANSTGLLAFTLGAAFGGVQNVLIHNILPTRGDKMVDGKSVNAIDPNTGEVKMVKRGGVMVPATEKSWATPRSREHDFTTRKFDTLKESVAHDFANFDKVENEMMAAQKAGNTTEAESKRQEIFNTGAMHAVRSGLTEPWKKTFDKIANMDQAAAVEAGYATDENDTSYKSRAQEAMADMDHLNGMYTTLQNKYGTKYQGNENADTLVDMVFARQTDIYSNDKIIKNAEKELVEMKQKSESLPGVADLSELSNSIKNMHDTRENHISVVDALRKDLEILTQNAKAGGDIEAVKDLLKKYRAIGMGDGDLQGAVNNLTDKMVKISQQTEKKAKDTEVMMLNTPEYVEWLNTHPDGKFNDFIKEVNDKRQVDVNMQHQSNLLEQFKTRHQLAKENLSDMVGEKNADKFVRKAEKWRDDMIAETERVQKEELASVAKMVKEKETLKRSDKLNLNRIAEDYRKERDAIAQKIVLNAKLLTAAREKLKDTSWSDPVKLYSVRNEIKALEKQDRILKAEFRKLDSLYSDHKVDMTPETVATEEATGEDTGVTTAEDEETAVTTTGEEETVVTAAETVAAVDLSVLDTVAKTTQALKNLVVQDMAAWDNIAFDESKRRYRTDEQIAQLYHDAKKNNTDPEFVAAVEALLVPTQEAQSEEIVVTPEVFTVEPNPFTSTGTTLEIFSDLLTPTDFMVKMVVGNAIDLAKQDGTALSLDLLNKQIADGVITQPEATKLLTAANDYLDELRNASFSSEPAAEETPEENTINVINNRRNAELKNYFGTNLELISSKNETVIQRNGIWGLQGKDYGPQKVPTAQIFGVYDEINKRYDDEIAGLNPIVPIAVILFAPLPEADSPEIDNSDAQEVIAAGDVVAYHAGDKIKNAADTGGTSTVGYHEGLAADASRGPRYIKIQNPSELNKTVNEDLLRMHGVPAGTDVEYVVDVDYDGPKHITDSLAWDQNQDVIKATEKGTDYMEDGKVKMNERGFGNVPIKVVDKRTGKTLTHIRKLDWLEMAFPNTLDRRNVVEKIVNPDGSVTNNFEIQRNLLVAHRKAIVEKFNATGQASQGKTGQIGTGHILLNHVIDEKADGKISSKVVPALASEMLPSTKLELVIGREGILESAKGFPSTLPMAFDQTKIPTGHVGVMIPTPNGQHLFAPLIGIPLAAEGQPSGAVASVVRVIELYMFNNSNPAMASEIAALRKETGFDVGTLSGLKAFINQHYTYTNGFADSVTFPNSTQTKKEKFMFSIDDKIENVSDKTKQIKVAFSRRGQKPVYANVENGKLKQNFIDALTEGFTERSRAVVHTDPGRGLKGINSKGSFKDAVFNNGAWAHKSYPSYNDYIKSFSTTSVYGKNKLSTGEYVYVANPILPLTFERVEEQPKIVANDTTTTVTVPDPAPLDQSMLDALDDLMNSNFTIPAKVKEIGTGTENSRELTEQSLREIYNFTPEAQRNGKTVLEMLKNLTDRGHTFISEGYNPFSKCS